MIEIIREEKALASITDEWNKLAKPFEFPLVCHEWFVACSEAFYNKDDLRIVIVRSGGSISAIAPLAVIKRNGIDSLEFMGSSFLYEPCCLLYNNRDSLQELLEGIFKLGRPVYFGRILADSAELELSSKLIRFRGKFVTRKAVGSLYVSINSSWNEFFDSLSPKRRYDLRRARRRAEEFGDITIRIFCPTLEELGNHLEMAFCLEAAGWKGRKGSAISKNKRLQHFFNVYSFLACQRRILRLCFLFIGEAPVATLIGLEHANRFWVLKIGYDERWSRCSPGIQLIQETIQYAFNNNMKSYEFLGSDEPWLHMWAKDTLRSYCYARAYPLNSCGLYGLGLDIFNSIYKRLSYQLQKKR